MNLMLLQLFQKTADTIRYLRLIKHYTAYRRCKVDKNKSVKGLHYVRRMFYYFCWEFNNIFIKPSIHWKNNRAR